VEERQESTMHLANQITRRQWLQAAAGATWVASTGAVAQAAAVTRILVGFPAGGGSDAIARRLAQHLQEIAGTPFIVENRPGAGGRVAALALKQAAPDGTTLMLSNDHAVCILPLTLKEPGYDPDRDFAPVGGIATFVNALALPVTPGAAGTSVAPDSPGSPAGAKPASARGSGSPIDLDSFVRAVRDGTLRGAVGVPAPASIPAFAVQSVGRAKGVTLDVLPYRGSAPMLADLLAGQIPAGVGSVPEFLHLHREGRVRVVAVMGAQRDPRLPEVPTFAELGVKGFERPAFYGLYAPAGTPAATMTRLSRDLTTALARPALAERLQADGHNVSPLTPAALAAHQKDYTDAWRPIIESSGFQRS
jgi:tripartite-type tricarboxylate transporter receptor subunit TctC